MKSTLKPIERARLEFLTTNRWTVNILLKRSLGNRQREGQRRLKREQLIEFAKYHYSKSLNNLVSLECLAESPPTSDSLILDLPQAIGVHTYAMGQRILENEKERQRLMERKSVNQCSRERKLQWGREIKRSKDIHVHECFLP